ncbi:6671_t:CDS:2 [Acaulospora morrowiae]|uniref:6671_t:CDS:1 n=1 Tax=Acaulospora morrowiae TaxID=94023 RepID=A0A9N9ADI4_9GLOM|nr:6671_t:CDS:2 [Acaulospora morrowiae]
MSFSWKIAGISYLKYTQVCARVVRNSLKEEQRLVAQRRDEQGLKYAKWESGKQGELKPVEEQRTG